jgi:hypothetical protein
MALKQTLTRSALQIGAVLAVAGSCLLTVVQAQTAAPEANKPVVRNSGNPARDNLQRLQTVVSIDETNTRMSNIIDFLAKETGANFDVLWKGDRSGGLDRDQELSASYKNLSAIIVLEKVLARYSQESGTASTWQISDVGAIQVGPKEIFNKSTRRVELYDINDLLFVMPTYDQAPEIDLEKVLQNQSGGGGGGGSPFRQNQQNNREPPRTKEDRGRDVIGLITSLVESDQWFGDVPEPKYYQGHIIVDAPDYMHRAINGYPFWPSVIRAGGSGSSRRYVSLTTENQLATVRGFVNTPVTGIVPGGPGR